MPKLKQVKMQKVMEAMRNEYPHLSIQFNITIPTNEHDVNIVYPANEIFRELDKYCLYSWFYTPYSENPLTLAGYFNQAFNDFLNDQRTNIERILRAYLTDYDPLENYSLKEEGSDGIKRSGEELRKKGNDSIQKTGTDTVENTGNFKEGNYRAGETVKNYVHGFDSADDTNGARSDTMVSEPASFDMDGIEGVQTGTHHVNDLKETTTHNTTDTTVYNTTDTKIVTNDVGMEALGGNKDTNAKFNETTAHYFTRNGNIGVTTSQQMLQSEIDLRKYRVLETFIREFAFEYLVLLFDEDDVDYEQDEGVWF